MEEKKKNHYSLCQKATEKNRENIYKAHCRFRANYAEDLSVH